uniref:Uncharacterized protein n=1 Tax=Opuntia streptacantha TaxID=393608 RepID=A0A7C9DN81_OPUST
MLMQVVLQKTFTNMLNLLGSSLKPNVQKEKRLRVNMGLKKLQEQVKKGQEKVGEKLNRDTGVLGLNHTYVGVLSNKVVDAVLGRLIKIVFDSEEMVIIYSSIGLSSIQC